MSKIKLKKMDDLMNETGKPLTEVNFQQLYDEYNYEKVVLRVVDVPPDSALHEIDNKSIGYVLDSLNKEPDQMVWKGRILTNPVYVHYYGSWGGYRTQGGEWDPDETASGLLELSGKGILEYNGYPDNPGWNRGENYVKTEVVGVKKRFSKSYTPISSISKDTINDKVVNLVSRLGFK